MERPGRPQRTIAFLLGAALFASIGNASACQRATRSGAPAPELVPVTATLAAKSFGDTLTAPVHIVSFDPVAERAEVSLSDVRNLVALAVIPGREIEILVPGTLPAQRTKRSGVYLFDLRRIDDDIASPDAHENAQARLAYDRCRSQAAATARRLEQQRRAVKRDSTGKIMDDGRGSASVTPADERMLEEQCDRLLTPPRKSTALKFLSARPPADRYFVVLASQSKLSLAQLSERLATLTAVAPDVSTTIEAIAAGVYAGSTQRWSGQFIRW